MLTNERMRAMDMPPFEANPETAATRDAISNEIATTRSLFLAAVTAGNRNRFKWWNRDFWVDQTRWIALPLMEAESFEEAREIPPEEQSILDVYGGQDRYTTVEALRDVLVRWVARTFEREAIYADGCHALNLLVVQPLVNPAFGSLLWIALALDLTGREVPNNFFDTLRAMMFDMAAYPTSRGNAVAIRAAQVDFVRRCLPSLVPPNWAELSDEEWAQACEGLYQEYGGAVDANVFGAVKEAAALLAPGDTSR
jgi:hypothetical protein